MVVAGACSRQEALSEALNQGPGYHLQRPVPSNVLLPARGTPFRFLILPIQHHELGKAFKYQPVGTFQAQFTAVAYTLWSVGGLREITFKDMRDPK